MLDAKHEYEVDMERAGWAPSPPIRDGAAGHGRRAAVAGARRRRRRGCRAAAAPRRAARAALDPGRGHPDAGEPGRPARPRRDHARGVRAQEGGPARPALSADATRGPPARYDTRDPRSQGAAWIIDLIDVIPAAIVVGIMLLVGLPVHEFSHALAAYRLGDGTAKMFGRLTLNPIAHFDPVGGTLLALTFIGSAASGGALGFGWAKPTPVNPMNLRAAGAARRSSRPPARSRTSSSRRSPRCRCGYILGDRTRRASRTSSSRSCSCSSRSTCC